MPRLLGLGAAEIDYRFPAIAQFADIGEFIEQPVKTYSSGMLMRLAFAVQTAIEPELLIVDEALAVGDARFQKSALPDSRELREQGTAILFVTHDTSTILLFCHEHHVWKMDKRSPKEIHRECSAASITSYSFGITDVNDPESEPSPFSKREHRV